MTRNERVSLSPAISAPQDTCAGRGRGSFAKRAYPSMKVARCEARSSMVENTRARRSASGPPASRRPECASEVIGASELLSSCAITRITFFQMTTSCAAISRVSCLNSSSRCGWLFSVKGRMLRWKISASAPSATVNSVSTPALHRLAEHLRRLRQQPGEADVPRSSVRRGTAAAPRCCRTRRGRSRSSAPARAGSSARPCRAAARAGTGRDARAAGGRRACCTRPSGRRSRPGPVGATLTL